MPFNLTKIKARHGRLVKLVPVTVSIGGTNYQGARQTLNRERSVSLYGEQAGKTQSLKLSAADLPASFDPDDLDLITVDGTKMRVQGYEYDSFRVEIRIDFIGRFD